MLSFSLAAESESANPADDSAVLRNPPELSFGAQRIKSDWKAPN
jgi:hypothetical protein